MINPELFLTVALAFLPFAGFSHRDTKADRHLEMSIGIPSILSWGDHFPSVSLKYKFGKNAARTGLCFTIPPKGVNSELTANLGFERKVIGKRLEFFAGADLGYTTALYNGISGFFRVTSYGIGPVLGLEYHVSKHFFLMSEAGSCARVCVLTDRNTA